MIRFLLAYVGFSAVFAVLFGWLGGAAALAALWVRGARRRPEITDG